MQLGMIGLGRMGMNMARRLLDGGHEVVAYNRTHQKVMELSKQGGGIAADSLQNLAARLTPPRIVWLMLPAGPPVDDTISVLADVLAPGDIIIDGGNSFYKDDIRRSDELQLRGIHYCDAGISGGIWGRTAGYCTMVGGERKNFDLIEPILKTLAPKDGYLFCGACGAGHFVKMVHNGIEYAMMQAYGEGFHLLQDSPYGKQLSFARVAHLWNQGSVIRSWLLELLETAFEQDPGLETIQAYVEDSGEGRWTVQQAVETGTPAPVIALSLFQRFGSRIRNNFSDRVLAALRKGFGGHAVKPQDR